MSMTQAPIQAHQPFYSPAAAAATATATATATGTTPMSFYTPNRKRRAPTPPHDSIFDQGVNGPSSSPAGSTTFQTPPTSATSAEHRDKRRRANLANVLSSMSLGQRSPRAASPLPSYDESQETQEEVDEDDLFQQTTLARDDLEVEVLPESSSRRVERQHLYASQSESEESESEESIDESIYRRPRRTTRRHAISTQQADEIEQPGSPWEAPDRIDFGVEDVTQAKRRKERDELDGTRPVKRRRSDIDMDMDVHGDQDDYEMRSRKAPTSYEPEKDRIIVTSLSDTESENSSRSGSPPPRRDISQPGSKGFTLSPSLLTHLLTTQRDSLKHPLESVHQEKGLVLYRPLGISPAPNPNPEIVQQWPAPVEIQMDDSGRFEELDEDEDQGTGLPETGGMDLDMEEPMQLD